MRAGARSLLGAEPAPPLRPGCCLAAGGEGGAHGPGGHFLALAPSRAWKRGEGPGAAGVRSSGASCHPPCHARWHHHLLPAAAPSDSCRVGRGAGGQFTAAEPLTADFPGEPLKLSPKFLRGARRAKEPRRCPPPAVPRFFFAKDACVGGDWGRVEGNELDTAQTLSSSSPTFPERPYLTLVQGQDWRERLVSWVPRSPRGVFDFLLFPSL